MKPNLVFSFNSFILGGAQKQLIRLLPELIDEYDIHLFVLFNYAGAEPVLKQLPSSVVVHQFDFKSFFSWREWGRVKQALKELSPDLVVSSLYFSNVVTRAIGQQLNIPVIPREHNTISHISFKHKLIEHHLARNTKTIVAVSKDVADSVSQVAGIERNKFTVINNGIDLSVIDKKLGQYDLAALRSKLNLPAENKVFLAVGRLVKQKRFDLLLESFTQFQGKHPGWTLLIVGDGGQRAALESLANELGISDQVRFAGEATDVSPYYQLSDALVSVSKREGMSNVHLEALAHGLPIISTPTGGTSEIIQDHKTGLIIEDGSPAGISHALEEFLTLPLSELRASSIQHRQHFSIKETAKQYKQLFQTTLG